MKEYKIEPGDWIEFNKINFVKENCVVSKEIIELLDREVRVKEIKDNKFRCHSSDEWIPMDWIKGITCKVYSEAEEKRKAELDDEVMKAYKKSVYEKLGAAWCISVIVLFILPIVLLFLGLIIWDRGSTDEICKTGIRITISSGITFLVFILDSVLLGVFRDKVNEKAELEQAEAVYKANPYTFQEAIRYNLDLRYLGKYFKSIGKEADTDKISEYRNERIEY